MSESQRNRLGRGLSALLPSDTDAGASPAPDTKDSDAGGHGSVRQLAVTEIAPSALQPRRIFDEEEMASLVKSIAEKGVLQPVLVRPRPDGGYELVAGERRWRAAQAARLHEIPAIVRDLDDKATLEIALIENLQRDALTPLEEARGYERLIDQFGHTQENVAKAVGKSRSHVANTLRLLGLPDSVKAHLDAGRLTAGHARPLLVAANPAKLADEIVKKDLNVRQAEQLAKRADETKAKAGKPSQQPASKDPNTIALERRVSDGLGLKATITFDGAGGRLSIDYRNLEQLDALIDRLLIVPERARSSPDALPPAAERDESNVTKFPGDKGMGDKGIGDTGGG